MSVLVVVLVQNLPFLAQLGDSLRGLKHLSKNNLINTRLSRMQGVGLRIVDETIRVGCTALHQCRGGAEAPAAGAAGGQQRRERSAAHRRKEAHITEAHIDAQRRTKAHRVAQYKGAKQRAQARTEAQRVRRAAQRHTPCLALMPQANAGRLTRAAGSMERAVAMAPRSLPCAHTRVDIRPPEKGKLNSPGARLVYQNHLDDKVDSDQ
jgi:hypothetical protein